MKLNRLLNSSLRQSTSFIKISRKLCIRSGSQYNLNKNQNKAIIIGGAAEKIMPTSLGKYLDLQKGSLTSMIDSLEKNELVCRKKDTGDRRKIQLVLTEKGENYREWLMEEFEKNASLVLK